MYRMIVCVLTVLVLAGTAEAQVPQATVWLQAVDGNNAVTLAVSETAVVQLWASINPAGDDVPG